MCRELRRCWACEGSCNLRLPKNKRDGDLRLSICIADLVQPGQLYRVSKNYPNMPALLSRWGGAWLVAPQPHSLLVRRIHGKERRNQPHCGGCKVRLPQGFPGQAGRPSCPPIFSALRKDEGAGNQAPVDGGPGLIGPSSPGLCAQLSRQSSAECGGHLGISLAQAADEGSLRLATCTHRQVAHMLGFVAA